MSSRKTKLLSYNLNNLGRTYTGDDRSNIDVPAMVRLINSPKVQEMINTGCLTGYYGHQIRQRFGMFPPETAIVDGRTVLLEPAIRTVEMRALQDGTVEHRQEFLDNKSGEFAMRQYTGNVGGFSTAARYKPVNGKMAPTIMGGFDYVWRPNYADNKGDGVLYDGLYIPEDAESGIPIFDSMSNVDQMDQSSAILARSLERQIVEYYDSISQQLALMEHANNALDQLGNALHENNILKDKNAIRARIQRERQNEMFESMVGEIRTFDSVLQEAQKFHQFEVDMFDETKDKVKEKGGVLPKWIRAWGW